MVANEVITADVAHYATLFIETRASVRSAPKLNKMSNCYVHRVHQFAKEVRSSIAQLQPLCHEGSRTFALAG